MSKPTAHRIPPQVCPACGYAIDGTTGVTADQPPKPGDLTLCFSCGEVLVFDERLQIRQPEPMELLRYQLSPNWHTVVLAQRRIRSRPPLEAQGQREGKGA